MRVEICDSWYYKKIVIPLVDKNYKCLAKLRKNEKWVIAVPKNYYSKWAEIILDLIKKFGTFVDTHKWVGYSSGSRMTLPGRRERIHEVYEIDEKLYELIKAVDDISKAGLTRRIDTEILDWDFEDLWDEIMSIRNEALAKLVTQSIKRG